MEMKKEMSLNLCELLGVLLKEYGSVKDIIKSSEMNVKSTFTRIYVGSYFCETYFLHSVVTTIEELEQYALDNNIKITLVIPIFTQSHLQKGWQIIDNILSKISLIDEVVVNDYGTLNLISSSYSTRIIIGRLLRKKARDYRYPEYEESKENVDTKVIYQKHSKVMGAEIDIASQIIDFGDFDSCYLPCIHIPFTYLTCGQLCDFAALDLDVFQKFNGNGGCNLNCNDLFYAYRTETGHDLYRIGKAVYYEAPQYEIFDTNKVRFVYFPFELWEKRYEYFGSDK